MPSPDRAAPTATTAAPVQAPPVMISDAVAKDEILAWFRGEFAAANAIIDALCSHLAQINASGGGGGGSEYDAVFAAIHRRRLNWIPVLQMQKYHSIAEVAIELHKVAEKKKKSCGNDVGVQKKVCLEEEKMEREKAGEKKIEESLGRTADRRDGGGEVVEEEDSPDSDITDSGCEDVEPPSERVDLCSNHEDCNGRPDQIKLTKGFNAKEQVKGHMVNVVKGLKLYEDVFTHSELSKLTNFVKQLRAAGINRELEGETYVLFNEQVKGNKRELIHLGIPIFGHIKEEATNNHQRNNIEPIPALLQGVIDHLIQWQLIPEYKKPNGCIIHFFDEEGYSQPFQKPPHLEQPISTILLSESTMAFGRTLVSDNAGNYRGPLLLSLKEGSVLVMRGHSVDMARHVMCPTPNKRISITFFKVRPDPCEGQSPPISPTTGALTVWQTGMPTSLFAMPSGAFGGYKAVDAMPKWGIIRNPVAILTPMRPTVVGPKMMPPGGTGVFLPWNVGSRKPAKHLPPRAQKGRRLELLSAKSHPTESTLETVSSVE